MKTPSTESFHSTRSRPSSPSESPPPPDTTSHRNAQVGIPLHTTLTTYYVGQLNNQCQTLGLSPCYEIDGDQQVGFSGYLQLGPHKITMDERWPSKKAAKEGLASKGLAIVKALQQSKRAEEASSAENWVGMLHSKLGHPRNQSCSMSFGSTSAHILNAHPGGGFLMALSSLPSNLWSNRRQCWPYLHRVHRRFPLCLHLPHLPPLDTLWFRISSLYQQESCESECGARSDEVSYFVWLCHTRWEAEP